MKARSTTGARRRRTPEQTRALMLEAGTQVALRSIPHDRGDDVGAAGPLAHVRLSDVADEATRLLADRSEKGRTPVTPGSLYQIWPTQAAFQVDLVFHLLEIVASPWHDDIERRALELIARGTDPEAAVGELSDMAFASLCGDPVAAITVGLFSLAALPAVGEAIRAGYAIDEDVTTPVFEALLRYSRRRLVDGCALRDLLVAVSALHEGLALRRSVDAETAAGSDPRQSLIAKATWALFETFTELLPDAIR